jgi:L-seryl-tRNA(Ser) seleniumtransferase
MRDETKALLRLLPSVEELLQHPRAAALLASYPRAVVADAVRSVLGSVRAQILQEGAPSAGVVVEPAALVALVETAIAEAERPHLRRVINATGVVVHTNLGRSVLAAQAVAEVIDVACHYSTLEYRLESGERGSRHEHVEGLLCGLTGAEAAMVVNNNAAAVLLVLLALAQQGEVLVSRGQLVEIGGSFRIPDIMHLSGARLVEVGTTNKTRIEDYEAAITPETSLLLRVHTSNFKIVGFTEEAPLEQLVALGRKYHIPVVDDLGSGALARLDLFCEEPDVRVSLATGVDLATFSGDKLLGGPQAGLILGRRTYGSTQAAPAGPGGTGGQDDSGGLGGDSTPISRFRAGGARDTYTRVSHP